MKRSVLLVAVAVGLLVLCGFLTAMLFVFVVKPGAASKLDISRGRVWTVTGPCPIDPAEPSCVTSANFPGEYGNNEYCFLQLEGDGERMLLVDAFDTEPNYDLFYVNYEMFSGTDTVHLDGRIITKMTALWWKSDHATSHPGWRICAQELNDRFGGPWRVHGDCAVDEGDPECITSANYPGLYNTNDSCRMRILGAQRVMDLPAFTTGRGVDKIVATNTSAVFNSTAELSGRSGAAWQGKLMSEAMMYTWQSKGLVPLRGWKICARPHPIWHVEGECNIESEEQECVSTGDSPYEQQGFCDCKMHVVAPREIQVTRYESDFVGDNLKAYNLFSAGDAWIIDRGSTYPEVWPHGAQVDSNTILHWNVTNHSAKSHSPCAWGGGWRLCARPPNPKTDPETFPNRSWDFNGSCQIDESDPDCITSRNYPNDFWSNDWCRFRVVGDAWRQLEVTDLRTICLFDNIRILPDGEPIFGGYHGGLGSIEQEVLDREFQGRIVNNATEFAWKTKDDQPFGGFRICARRLHV